MKEIWLNLCAAHRVPILSIEPRSIRFFETGLVLVRDKRGGILPLGSFDICDRTRNISVFPCHMLNARDYEQILAAAAGLMAAWEGFGVVTFRFACQPDGHDFVLLDTEEGDSPAYRHCCALRKLPADKLLESIAGGGNVSAFGPICALASVGIALQDRLVQGLRLEDTLASLPEESFHKETMLPWYARMVWPEESDAQ